MTDTITTHAAALAATFAVDSDAIARRVAVLEAARADGVTTGKSLTELTHATVLARVQRDYPTMTPEHPDYADTAKHPRYSVSRATIGAYSLAANVLSDMGLSTSDLTNEAVHAVFRTTNNRAGIADYRREAVADIIAAPATERAAMVLPRFNRVLDDYRASQKVPDAGKGGPDTSEDRIPTADVADVERTADAATVAAVPPSAEVIVAAIERAVADTANLSDADALRVFDALDAAWQALAPRIDALTGATV